MEVYFVLFITIFTFSMMNGDGRSKVALVGLFFCLLIIIAFRNEVGGDWTSYLRHNQEAKSQNFIDGLDGHGEIGYAVINWISANYFQGIYFANLFCGCIFLFGLYRFALLFKDPYFAVLLAYPQLIVVVGMAYTRQSVAIGSVMIAYCLYKKWGALLSLLILTFGAVFHRTLLPILFIFSFIALKGIQKAFALFILMLLVIFNIEYLISATTGLSDNYLYSAVNSGGVLPRISITVISSILFLLNYKKFNLEKSESTPLKIISIISIALFPMAFFEQFSTAIDRMNLYLMPLQIFCLSKLAEISSKPEFFKIFIGFLLGFELLIWLIYANHSYAWLPYKSFLFDFD